MLALATLIFSNPGVCLADELPGSLASVDDWVLICSLEQTIARNSTAQEFMLLATDGLWDVVSSQEAVDMVWENWDLPDHGISKLILHAYRVGSTDNMFVSQSPLLLACTEFWRETLLLCKGVHPFVL